MRKSIAVVAAGAMSLAPATALAARPDPGSITPPHATGQQVGDFVVGGGLECGDDGTTPPGNSGVVHGNPDNVGSPFVEGSVSGSHYAGEQTQNQVNTTSVSQYDIACFGGSPRP